MFNKLTDDDLMNRIQAGEEGAFEALVDRYGNLVFGYCLRTLGGNRAQAEDLVQDIWLKIVTKVEGYDRRGKFKSWLMMVAHNAVVSHLRKKTNVLVGQEFLEANAISEENLEEALMEKNQVMELRKTIETLSEEERVVLAMSLVEGISYAEIAANTGASEASVRSTLFRARRNLKQILGES